MTQVSNQAHDPRPQTPKAAAACCRPIDGLLSPDLFKALGDPTRASLLACLIKCGRPCLVTEIAECCAVDLSVVSRHLALMERAGLLTATREGRTVAYAVRHADLARTLRAIADELETCCHSDGGPCCG